MANERVRHLKCTNGFFAGIRGQVYPGEYLTLLITEAMDVISGGKCDVVPEDEASKGPRAFDVNNPIRRALAAEETKRAKIAAALAAKTPMPDGSAPVTDINSGKPISTQGAK